MPTTFDNNKNASPASSEPYAVSNTTPPRDTFHEVSLPAGDGMLMYWPERNAFLALFPDEYRDLYAEADEHSRKIAKLHETNQKVTEAAVQLREAQKSGVLADMQKAEATLQQAICDMRSASDDVKKTLQPLSRLDEKDGAKMVELLSLRKRKEQDKQKAVPIYVKSTKLKQILADQRIYLVDGEKQKRAQDKVFKDGKLNTDEIKKRIADKVQDKAKFSKKWKLKPEDAEMYSGVLFDWAKTMNGTIAEFLEQTFHERHDPDRQVDLSAAAQLMRYAAGAGLEINFNPFKGNLFDERDTSWPKRLKRGLKSGELGIKANAHAAFAIAEGRIRASLYLPHYAGWHATVAVADQVFELGYWRFEGDIILSGSAGACLAVELDVGLSYVGGKQGLRGIPTQDKDKPGVKARAGANAELDVFAGAEAGVEAMGALQWLNPEGAGSNGKPLKVKPNQAIAEFKDIAKVDTRVVALAGVGLKGAFQIRHEEGKFVIHVKVGACLGFGAERSMKYEVRTETIGEFFKCVAYQLKRADYHKIVDAIERDAYQAYCQVKYLVIVSGKNLEEFVVRNKNDLLEEYNQVSKAIDNAIKNGAKSAEDFIQRIRAELQKQTGGWFTYAPPEVLGKIQMQIASLSFGSNATLQEQSRELMALALGAPQTMNQLATIAERMTEQLGDKQDSRTGLAIIDACLAGTPYAGYLLATERRLANIEPLLSQPFIWNSEPEFAAARMGIEHPMFG